MLVERMIPRVVCSFVVLVALSGCITTSSGGIAGPAPDRERLAAQLDLARGYLEQRDWTRAKAPLERALKIDPNDVEAHVLSAVLFQAQNEKELAERHYRQALRIDPDHAQALNNYASFLYSQGRFAEALKPLERLVDDTSYRARAQAFESLGLSYMQVGEQEKAEAAFRRALQLNIRLPRSNLELAELAFASGDMRMAQSQFDFYNRIAKPNARSLCLGLKLAHHAGNADLIARYDLALKNLYPDEAEQCRT